MSFTGSLSSQSAAPGMVLADQDGLTLLVRTHNRSDLVLPGGVVEQGESPTAAAEREVLEEVGPAGRWRVS